MEEAEEIEIVSSAESPLHPVARVIFVVAGSGLLVLLGIAAWLTPSEKGFGTHRQLQIPLLGQGEDQHLAACSFLVATGKPCPSCGMTTSWAHLLNANLLASARANVAGTLLCIVALISAPWMLVSGVKGSFFIGHPSDRSILVIGLSLLAVILTNWVYRMLS